MHCFNILDPTVTLIISRCLSGEAVRYDGKSKPHSQFTKPLINANVITYCPEIEAQLDVPRPAIRLIARDKGIEAIGVSDTQLNVTTALQYVSDNFTSPEQPQAFILKSRSPSCGISNTPILEVDGHERLGSGIFAAKMAQRYPLSFLLDDETFHNDNQLQLLLDYCLRLKDLQLTRSDDLHHYCTHYQLTMTSPILSHRLIFNTLDTQLRRQLAY